MDHVTRGYFGLPDNDHIVHVTSDKDLVLYIWAPDIPWRNSDRRRANSAVLVLGSTGSDDGLVLDVPLPARSAE